MVGFVIIQLAETRVLNRPSFSSLWSHGKQTTFFWSAVNESYRALTAVSGALVLVGGAAVALAVTNSGTPPATAAAVAKNPRRSTPGVQSGHSRSAMASSR